MTVILPNFQCSSCSDIALEQCRCLRYWTVYEAFHIGLDVTVLLIVQDTWASSICLTYCHAKFLSLTSLLSYLLQSHCRFLLIITYISLFYPLFLGIIFFTLILLDFYIRSIFLSFPLSYSCFSFFHLLSYFLYFFIRSFNDLNVNL